MCLTLPLPLALAPLFLAVLPHGKALELVRSLGELDLIGMDLVEVSPPFDHSEVTALAAATIAHDWLAVLATQKRAKQPTFIIYSCAIISAI